MSDRAAGYSGGPLITKLGIKPSFAVAILNAPANYERLLGTLPDGVITREPNPGDPVDFIHLFIHERTELERRLPHLRECILSNGMIWVSWPKKASKVPTDITEDVVRAAALANRLVDVKVCAVDEVWSALKLVIRRIDR